MALALNLTLTSALILKRTLTNSLTHTHRNPSPDVDIARPSILQEATPLPALIGERVLLADGCADLSSATPSSASKLFYSRLGAEAMPHHNLWQIFCQPELRPCCTDGNSFLQVRSHGPQRCCS